MAMNAERLAQALIAVAAIEIDEGATTEESTLVSMRAFAQAIISEVQQAEVTGTAANVTVGAGSSAVTGTIA